MWIIITQEIFPIKRNIFLHDVEHEFSEQEHWNSALMADFIFIFMSTTMSFLQLQSFTTKGQH